MPFKNGILGVIPAEDYLNTNWTPNRPAVDPTSLVFYDEATDNLIVRWRFIASEYQIPVMAQFHAFDTEAQKAVRIPLDDRTVEKGLIKVKANTSELLRQLIKSGTARSDEQALYNYVFEDSVNLAEWVVTRANVAKNELLATGEVTIHENGLDLTVDYGVPQGNVSKTLDFGAGASAPITEQLQSIIDDAKDAGQALNGIYTSSAMLGKLRNNQSIQIAVNGTIGAGATVKRADLETYLADEFGITRVITQDNVYVSERHEDSTTHRPAQTTERLYPKDRMTFFSSNINGFIGSGLWGAPPEVEVNGIGGINVEPASLNGFVWISQTAEYDPAILWTKASALFMPALYNPSGLYVARATETPGAGA